MTFAPSNSVCIEPASESDLPSISRLAAEIWRACYPGIITDEQIEYMLSWMYSPDTLCDEFRFQGIRYDRLTVSGELSGFASYGPTGETGVMKLHKLYLLPAMQRHGLGTLLLQHCEREVCKLGARRLILNVNKRNTKAISVYQRNGFRISDSVVADIGGGFVMDDHIMAKELIP
jgi:GNAT superfamily N-acetyltransferase